VRCASVTPFEEEPPAESAVIPRSAGRPEKTPAN
jgi:hypothetical protein